MLASLPQRGKNRRVIFYDELSHMNPIYGVPAAQNDLYPLELEKQYHLHNLRLLSMYYDNIAMMTGNVTNFPNHTTKAIVLSVLDSSTFRTLCELGVILFCGWGAHNSTDMVQNQLSYAEIYRPELKDRHTRNSLRDVMSLTDILVREETAGEEGFVSFLLDKLRLQREQSSEEGKWRRLEDHALEIHDRAGHVGTLDFFPELQVFSPLLKRQVHKAYFDAWLDYASKRYNPVNVYESPRLGVNPFRTIQIGKNYDIASILLSPQFFQAFLLRFVSARELSNLLGLPPEKIVQLRNGDWRIFCDQYHTYIEACSKVFWNLQVISAKYTGKVEAELLDHVIDETLRELPGSIDGTLLLDFLSHALGYLRLRPETTPLITTLLRPFAETLAQRARAFILRVRSHEIYPFIAKLRLAVA